jgi:hypothetical protein
MKTARFTDVVAAAGPPQVHALWIAPGRDAALKRAVKECRVMTIHQRLRGTRKDYGTVGLQADESSQVLVFPKTLRRFGEARIVGIDYQLIIQPEAKDPAAPFVLPKKRPMPAAKEQPGLRTGSASGKRGSHPSRPPPSPPKPAALTRDQLLAEIRRAVGELKAGKAVAAYERLSALEE